MSAFPSAEAELREVNRFLEMFAALDPAPSAVFDQALDHAHAYKTRLETPVRIAFTGKSLAGKSSLINLLIGEKVLPTGKASVGSVTVMVRHSLIERTTASWWDRPSVELPGRALAQAAELGPDIITLDITCEPLEGLSLIDIVSFDDAESSKRAVFSLMRLADVMLWCSRAENPMIKADSESWRMIPGRLIRNSMLILTHAEDVDEAGIAAAKEKLTPDRLRSFRDVIPVSTKVAMLALSNPGPNFEELWSVSGAQQLVESVIAAAVELREAEIEKIRRGLAQFIQPAQAELDALARTSATTPAPTSDPVVPPAAVPVVPAPTPIGTATQAADAQLLDKLRQDWFARARSLLDRARDGDYGDPAEFVMAAQEEVDGFRDRLSDAEGQLAESDELIAECEKANDILILLQFESADSAALDAARIVVQLSEGIDHLCPAGQKAA
ncbi:dynamin family protein [Frigidibacter sp. RF13]|uniref:dynamin family protein n=1 Tax=Frigidibacter sp. RF13 TaxID=2997340 RepID=UPI002270F7F5|nr:dynamin family protein [Frigidibacter sp. RF13]MCY1128266.1 dynamin family protein [Frigidibacter sp. RF13]